MPKKMSQKQVNEKYFHIADLISKFLSESIDDEQMNELNQWRNGDPKNEALFQRITSRTNIEQFNEARETFDKDKAWESLNGRLYFFRRKYMIKTVIKYAAVLLVPIGIAAVLLTTARTGSDNTTHFSAEANQITSGEKKAALTLADGKTIDLQNLNKQEFAENDGTTIVLDSTSLNYRGAPAGQGKEIFNKLDIPRGGEYALILSDGTKVFINSMSSLRFPVNFIADKRVVELEGEAYFQVAKNGKPFIVKLDGMEVEVLGTDFNVSAYKNEEYQTTLVNGSVKINTKNGQNRILKPSEQARYSSETNNLSVEKVDTEFYTSWIKGKIYFKDQCLGDIMKALSRWYDMEVVYQNENLKSLKFGCYVDKYKEIDPFLELLHETEKVDVQVNNKQIIIKPNK
jgi:ferric-dicitrate binding protein FerR (iron transport regulator)